MQVSASIFSDKTRSVDELVREIQEASTDMIHFDFPMNTTPDFDLLRSLRPKTRLPFDGHLIHPDPVPFLQQLEQIGFDQTAIQAELMTSEDLNLPHKEKYLMKVGLALQVTEGFQKYLDYIPNYDFVLVMATVPGVSGMKFQASAYEVIDVVRKKYPHIPIEVDGGVNEEIAQILSGLKVDIVVSGSSLLNANPIKSQLAKLVGKKNPNFLKKILIPKARTPIARLDDDFESLIQTIGFYRLGGTLVADANNKLLGVITNGDLRGSIAKYKKDIFSIKVKDILNTKPTSLYSDMGQEEIVGIISSVPHYFSIIPILDRDQVIVGSTSSDRVIRG